MFLKKLKAFLSRNPFLTTTAECSFTHTRKHTHIADKSNFKKPVTRQSSVRAWFKNRKVLCFILRVMWAYLDSDEKHCSQISVSTCLCLHVDDCFIFIIILTLSNWEKVLASEFALHHWSVWPCTCIVSITISTWAKSLVVLVRSFCDVCLAYLHKWHPSS